MTPANDPCSTCPANCMPICFTASAAGCGRGGLFLCTLSDFPEDAYTEDDFFGVTMYWSNHGIHEYREILTGIGFSLLQVSATGPGYQEGTQPPERHPLVLTRRE